MTIQELNHVAIYVSDVTASSDFYGRVLRLEAISRPAFNFPGAWFRLGSSQELHLIGNRGVPLPQLNHNNHFALRVDDIDGWERHLKEAALGKEAAAVLARAVRTSGLRERPELHAQTPHRLRYHSRGPDGGCGPSVHQWEGCIRDTRAFRWERRKR